MTAGASGASGAWGSRNSIVLGGAMSRPASASCFRTRNHRSLRTV
ncbi:Uncharacterised protein [Bordetella pertussis]|nr:Uncharacterised protein [Bordetella pertussis]CPN62379.1 Uncharacterised protein [Bordetella pertussis]